MPALPYLYRNQAADLLEEVSKEILEGADVNECQNKINNTLNAIKAEAVKRPEGPRPPKADTDTEDAEDFSSLND